MFPQTLPLPFQVLTPLRELKNRHPFWRFIAGKTITTKYILVEIDTPQLKPQFPSIWVQVSYPANTPETERFTQELDKRLKEAVAKQMDFTRSFVQ